MNPYRQAREVENDALARMTEPSPKEIGWDEGYAAGLREENAYPQAWRYGAAEERERSQAMNALLSEQLEEARRWHLAAVNEKRAAQADAERLFTALDGYIMARITGTDLREYDDLAERAARAHRRLADLDESWELSPAATPDPPDEAAIRADERERLSARVYENGWCPTCGTKTADPGVIPGPDPGACPACGGWRKAGMIHRCPPGATPEDERARIGAEERKRITDLLRDGAARRELRANRPGNAAATTLMASWEALRLAADVIERSAGSAGSDGEDRPDE